jgi:hypothetical protein
MKLSELEESKSKELADKFLKLDFSDDEHNTFKKAWPEEFNAILQRPAYTGHSVFYFVISRFDTSVAAYSELSPEQKSIFKTILEKVSPKVLEKFFDEGDAFSKLVDVDSKSFLTILEKTPSTKITRFFKDGGYKLAYLPRGRQPLSNIMAMFGKADPFDLSRSSNSILDWEKVRTEVNKSKAFLPGDEKEFLFQSIKLLGNLPTLSKRQIKEDSKALLNFFDNFDILGHFENWLKVINPLLKFTEELAIQYPKASNAFKLKERLLFLGGVANINLSIENGQRRDKLSSMVKMLEGFDPLKLSPKLTPKQNLILAEAFLADEKEIGNCVSGLYYLFCSARGKNNEAIQLINILYISPGIGSITDSKPEIDKLALNKYIDCQKFSDKLQTKFQQLISLLETKSSDPFTSELQQTLVILKGDKASLLEEIEKWIKNPEISCKLGFLFIDKVKQLHRTLILERILRQMLDYVQLDQPMEIKLGPGYSPEGIQGLDMDLKENKTGPSSGDSLKNQSDSIKQLIDMVADLKQEIIGLKKEVAGQTQEVTGLKKEMEEMRAELRALKMQGNPGPQASTQGATPLRRFTLTGS